MEPWRKIWRGAVVECLGHPALAHLLRGLASNDPRLIRGANTEPPCSYLFAGDDPGPCRGACPLAYGLWQDRELTGAVEVEAAFVELLEEIGTRAGSPLAVAPLLDWIDFAPWNEVRLELMGEIGRALAPVLDSAPGSVN